MTRPTLKSRLFFFLFALLAGLGGGGVAGLEERPCTVHSSDGSYYDLNPLSASKDYDITTPGGHRIILNVCRSVQEETWNLKVDDPKDVAGFIRRDHGDFSIGKTNTTLVMQPDNEGPQLTMRDGSRCTSKSGATQDSTASTTILFTCDTSVFGAGKPQLLWSAPEDEDEACSWLIQWKTHYACPRGERGGIWGFFTFVAVIILLLLTLYLTLGTLYNRYALKLRGFDQLPQFSIEGAKYHVQEMWDVARDADWREVFEGMSRKVGEGVRVVVGWFSQGETGRAYGRVPSGPEGYAPEEAQGGFRRPAPRRGPSGGVPNSYSHQAQVDVGSGGVGAMDAGGDGVGRSRGGLGGIGETNPVSHFSQTQTQTQQNLPQPQNSSAVPNPPKTMSNTGDGFGEGDRELAPLPKKSTEDVKSTQEERTAFLLGNEDEEAEDEEDITLGDNTAKPLSAQSSHPHPQSDTSQPSQNTGGQNQGQGEVNEAARLRGRDLSEAGGKGVIRL